VQVGFLFTADRFVPSFGVEARIDAPIDRCEESIFALVPRL
jgi:hypothetical protein